MPSQHTLDILYATGMFMVFIGVMGILIVAYLEGYFTKKAHCSHEFHQDTHITILKCHKCGMKGRYMGIKNLYPIKHYENSINR